MPPRPSHRQCPWTSSRRLPSSAACPCPQVLMRVLLLRQQVQGLTSCAFLRHIRECICLWSRILRYGGLCVRDISPFPFLCASLRGVQRPRLRCVNLLVFVINRGMELFQSVYFSHDFNILFQSCDTICPRG